MAVTILGEAGVRLRPNTSGFSEQANVEIMGPLKEVAKRGAELFGVAWGAEKTFDYLKDSVKAYSDTTEASTKAQTVFGGSFEEVQKFAENAAGAMGQSTSQALKAAGGFGNLFRSMGVASPASATMSVGLTKLASDLASFNNVPVDQALNALQSGVTGMTRPLKQFGVNITAAQIQTEAATLGLTAHGKALDAGAKAQATYALIMKQTTLTQGDFTRTSKNLADQQRIIAAESENLKDKVGSAIYPFVDLAARGITGGVLPALIKLATPLEKVGEKGKVLGDDLSELTGSAKASFQGFNVAGDTAFTSVGAKLGKLASDAQGDMGVFTDAFKGGGLGVLATEPSVAGFLARFGSGLRGLRTEAQSTWGSIVQSAAPMLTGLRAQVEPALLPVKAALGNLFSGATAGLAGGGGGFISFFSGILARIGPLITGVIGKVAPMIQQVLPVLSSAFSAILPILSNVFRQVGPVISAVLPVILQISGIMSTLFRTAFMALLPVIPPLVQTIGQLVTTLVGGLSPILLQLAPLISTLISTGLNEFKAVLSAIVPILPPLIGAIGQVAQIIAGALLTVLAAIMPILPVLAKAFGQIAVAIGGALITAVSAIAPLLPTLINAFMSLVQAALLPLLPLLPAIASLIPPLVGVIVALVQAVAPFLPLIIRVVVTLVQLAVVALQPLLPIIQIAASLLVVLVRAMVPIISIALQVVSWLLRIAGALTGGVITAVSSVIGWFQRLLSGISGVVSQIGGLLGGMFSGLGSAAQAAFGAVTGAIRWAINGYIGIINGAIGFINSNLIGTINKIPGVSVPTIPHIPTLHEGGEFTSGSPAGEGLALLRDNELVVTPEQRTSADDLLRALLDGKLPAAPAAAQAAPGHAPITIEEHLHAAPGESLPALAARVTQGVVWNLNSGITRTVGTGAVGS